MTFQRNAFVAAVLAACGTAVAQDPAMMAGIGWRTDAVFTIGDFSIDSNGNAYQPVGIPDGMAAFENPNGDGALLLVNNELSRGQGRPWSLENGTMLTGARVTRFIVERRADGSGFASMAEDAIERVYDVEGNLVTDPSQINVATGGINGFGRFCSSYGIAGGTFGFIEDVYFTGEEDSTNEGGLYWALDVDTGDFWAVPSLPRASWENLAPFETGDPQTIGLALMDDSTGTPFYIYIGQKNAIGDSSFLDRNGLAVGTVYYLQFDDPTILDAMSFRNVGTTEPVSFVQIDPKDAMGVLKADSVFRDEAEAGGAYEFARLEDIHVNPANGTQLVLVTTGNGGFAGGADAYGDTVILDLTIPATGAPTGVLKIVADGDDLSQPLTQDFGLRSPDNLCWADNGKIYIQEDRSVGGFGAGSGREASIWELDPDTFELVRVGEMNRTVVLPLDATDNDPSDVGDWESSGIIDVTSLFDTEPGETLLLANVQAHSVRDGSIGGNAGLAQGGQIFFMSNAGIDHAIRTANTTASTFDLSFDFSNFEQGDIYAIFLSFANAGVAPNGFFFGITPTLSDLSAFVFDPFVGTVGMDENFGFSITIPGQAPVGIRFDSVTVAFDAATFEPVAAGPAVTHDV